MIDVHSHILEGLDDGVDSFEEALCVVKEAKKVGFTKIISTTHYFPDKKYLANEDVRKHVLQKLKENVDDVEIVLGSEIFVNGHIDELIKNGEASTINGSRYILFEIPLYGEYSDLKNVILNLLSNGYKLILAHPERYEVFQDDPRRLEDLIDLGVYLQANYLSIIGFYGKQAQKLVTLMLKHNMISFLGSDVHQSNRFYPNINEAIEKIVLLIGEEKFEELSEFNPMAVINNDDIECEDYISIEKNLFGKYK